MKETHQSPAKANMSSHSLSEDEKAYFARQGAVVATTVVVLGRLPLIKNKHGGRLHVGDRTVLNSDNENSNTPIPTPVKFVLGVGAIISIGQNCDLNGVAITAYTSVLIGDRVQIGAGGLISDTDFHPVEPVARRKQILGEPFSFDSVSKAEVVIKDDVWIGYGVIILKGVTIGEGSIVGAGSVVTKSIPDYCIAVGNPARVVKKIDVGND